MALNNTSKNVGLTAIKAVAIFASLHSADPSTTGANELAGGSPAYARKSITWGTATGGILLSSNTPVFDVESGDTVHSVGLWSASTAGTFYGFGVLSATAVFGAQGTFTLDSATLTITD